MVELLATYQMDWLTLDTEHGAIDKDMLEHMVRAMKGTEVVPIVRVGGNDPVLIKRALDRGAFGIIVPLVNTPEQARAVVADAEYPPDGIRGVAGTRANRFGLDLADYFTQWNSQVLVICQIETVEALQNIEGIARCRASTCCSSGPTISPPRSTASASSIDRISRAAVDRILKATRQHRIAAGYMASSTEEVLERVNQGFGFVSNGTDARMLAAGATASYAKIKAGLAERVPAYRIAGGQAVNAAIIPALARRLAITRQRLARPGPAPTRRASSRSCATWAAYSSIPSARSRGPFAGLMEPAGPV